MRACCPSIVDCVCQHCDHSYHHAFKGYWSCVQAVDPPNHPICSSESETVILHVCVMILPMVPAQWVTALLFPELHWQHNHAFLFVSLGWFLFRVSAISSQDTPWVFFYNLCLPSENFPSIHLFSMTFHTTTFLSLSFPYSTKNLCNFPFSKILVILLPNRWQPVCSCPKKQEIWFRKPIIK